MSIGINKFFEVFSRSRRDPRLLPILAPEDILTKYGGEQCVAAIRRSVGIADYFFDRYYRSAIHNLAALVQLCPGSEAHHHAFPGGLATHILESCANSLEFRKGMILPIGSTAEVAATKRDIYNYAVFAAALLHDVAKPLTDQQITLHSRSGRYLCDWDPASQKIASIRRAAFMRVKFRPNRVYAHHQHSSLIFLPRVLPAEGFAWIQSDHEVYGEFLDAFSTDPSGPIYQLVAKGDQASVSRALGAQQLPQFDSASRPLWMKIKTALRYLVEQGELSLNRRGSAGWVDDRGVWLMSKRAVDAVREQLGKEGHTGVPGDNNRLFDIMSESGLLSLNDQGKAIWRCRVSIGEWAPESPFSLILLSHDTFWSDPESVPWVDGRIEVLDAVGDAGTTPEEIQEAVPATDTSAGDSSSELVDAKEPVSPVASEERGGAPGERRSSEAVPQTADPAKNHEDGQQGELFRRWIEQGINQATFTVNTKDSFVHFLEQGVLLVSPIAFKQYGLRYSVDWEAVQKSFQSLKINLKNPGERGENWWQVRVAVKGRPLSLMKGWIVPFAHFDLQVAPEPNPTLFLINPKESAAAGGAAD